MGRCLASYVDRTIRIYLGFQHRQRIIEAANAPTLRIVVADAVGGKRYW